MACVPADGILFKYDMTRSLINEYSDQIMDSLHRSAHARASNLKQKI